MIQSMMPVDLVPIYIDCSSSLGGIPSMHQLTNILKDTRVFFVAAVQAHPKRLGVP